MLTPNTDPEDQPEEDESYPRLTAREERILDERNEREDFDPPTTGAYLDAIGCRAPGY